MIAALIALVMTAAAQEAGDQDVPRSLAPAPRAASQSELAVSLYAAERRDEALATWRGALADPAERAGALARAQATLLASPPRLAWEDVGESILAAGPADPVPVQVWLARARALDPARRAAARRELTDLHKRYPEDPGVSRALADVHMLSGDLASAIRVDPRQVPTSCRAADSSATAALSCANDLENRGDAAIAESLLEASLSDLPPADRPLVLATLAAYEEGLGKRSEAIAHLEAARKGAPDGDAGGERLRMQLAALYLLEYRTEEALDVLPAGEAPQVAQARRSAAAIARLRGVDPTATSSADEAAVQDAWRLAPEHPIVAASYAHHLLARGKGSEALEVLEPALAQHGYDGNLLDLHTWAAGVANQPQRGVIALQNGLKTARDPETWNKRLIALARFQATSAEAEKAAGQVDAAIERYQLARALSPEEVGLALGLGGACWAAGDLACASEAYSDAYRQAPGNRDALLSLAGVMIAQDRAADARQLIANSGFSDIATQELEEELEIMVASREARQAAAAGRHQEAAARYREVELQYPGHPALLHGMADSLMALGQHEEAARAYAQARRREPDDPWLTIGEARAWAAAGDTTRAKALLDGLEGNPAADAREARAALDQARAEVLLAQGDTAGAFVIYSDILEQGDPPPWILLGIAGLYRRTGQDDLAHAFYLEAADAAAKTGDAAVQRDAARALMQMGYADEAQRRARELYLATPDAANQQLLQETEQARQRQRIAAAVQSGRVELAEELLRDHLQAWPEDVEARALLAELLLGTGREEEAFEVAKRALQTDPNHGPSLGALRRAGAALGRSAEVQRFYEQATADWVTDERPLVELAAALEAALAGERGDRDEAIRAAARRYGNDDARRWVMIGSAWLALERYEDARSSYEIALSLDPDNDDAALGLAGSLQALGEDNRAERVLAMQWERTRDPGVRQALEDLRRRLGRRRAADALDADTSSAASPGDPVSAAGADLTDSPSSGAGAVSRSGGPLPALATPSGRQPVAQDRPQTLDQTLRQLDADSEPEPPAVRWEVGGGQADRPGEIGAQQLQLRFFTLDAELPDWWGLGAQITPVYISDGERALGGVAVAGRLSAPFTPVGATLRVGTTPYFGEGDGIFAENSDVRMTWFGGLRAKTGGGLEVAAEAFHSPVADSLTSLVGGTDESVVDEDGDPAFIGQVMDTALGGQVMWSGRGSSAFSQVGVLARAGQTTGVSIAPLAWQQVHGWALSPLQETEAQRTALRIEGSLLQHDRQADGFEVGQAGMFSPLGFYSLTGTLEGDWSWDGWSLCGRAGVSGQRIDGENTLYLGSGTYLGFLGEVGVSAALSELVDARAGYRIEGSLGSWYQSLGTIQVGHNLVSPGPEFVSLVHSPPLIVACQEAR